MEKEKNILHGVVLLFCINIIASFFIQLTEIAVCKFFPNIYITLLLNLVVYAAILYIVFGKIKKFPKITILIFVAIFILRSISSNLSTFFLSHDEMEQMNGLQNLDNLTSLIYSLVFAGLAYRCYKKKIKEESEDAYIYYGMILFILTYTVASIITYLLLMASQMVYIPYIVAGILAICCITLFVYMFLKLVKNNPTIHPLVMFIIIVAGSLSPLLLEYGNPSSTYNDITEYGYTSSFLSIISGWTYILIAILVYVKYYNSLKKGTNRLGIIGVLAATFVFLACFAVNYVSINLWQKKVSNASFYKMKAEMPAVITDHMPDDAGLRSKASYSDDNYTSLITYLEGSSAVKKCEELLSKGYLGKYEANDPHLVCLSIDRIKKKLKAERVAYSTLDINGVMYYPVPEFDFNGDPDMELNLCGLPSDFTIYIIEAKPEKLREKSDLARIMPQGWENGYTKGVCISKQHNSVIYWGATW